MPTTLSAQESMWTIDRFIQEVGAAEKRAEEAHTEPGSIGGETSHPVKNVDDRTQVAQEGSRSAENTADVKEDQGKPSVENAPEASSEGTIKASAFDLSRFAKPIPGRTKKAEEGKSQGGAVMTPGSAADDHMQIGTNVQPTGEDPSVETSSAKAGKEDPGSSHPARTDNEQLDGHKYSADQLANMPLEKLAGMVSDLGNDLCAALAVEEPHRATTKRAADAGDLTDAQVAHQAGWELAGLLTGNFDKKAADNLVENTLQEIIKTAEDDADRVATFLDSYYHGLKEASAVKEAEGEMPPMDPSQMPPPPGGGLPMGDAGGPPPGGGGEEEMLSALGGEPGLGGEGEPGMEGDVDPQTMELAQVLEELGVTPEELEQAMQADEAGGLPPEGGEGEEPMAPKEGADRRTKTAGVKRGNTRDGVREYIQEVISRSRRRK